MSTVKPDAVLVVSVAALVPALFGACLPPVAELRARNDPAGHDAATLRAAAVGGVLVVAGVSFGTGNVRAGIAGLVAVLGLTVLYGHAIGSPA